MKILKWIGIAVVGFIVIGFLSAMFGDNNTTPTSTNPAAAPQAQQQAPDNKFIKSGMYKIGTDIPAGEYLIFSSGTSYYQVTKDSTGSLESIISNDNFSGTRYITVSDGQYLEIRNSKMISASEAEPQQPKNNQYLDGMYKVGKDIPPGEYKVASTGGLAYFEVSKNSKGTLESIISNDNFEGEKYISIKDGQYIKLNGCKLIK